MPVHFGIGGVTFALSILPPSLSVARAYNGMHLGADGTTSCHVKLLRGKRYNNLVFCQGLPACRPRVAEVIKRAAVSDWVRHRGTFVRNAKLSSAGRVQALPDPLAFSPSLAPLSGVTLLGAEVLVAALFALIITACGNRPRGWCDHSLVQARFSGLLVA